MTAWCIMQLPSERESHVLYTSIKARVVRNGRYPRNKGGPDPWSVTLMNTSSAKAISTWWKRSPWPVICTNVQLLMCMAVQRNASINGLLCYRRKCESMQCEVPTLHLTNIQSNWDGRIANNLFWDCVQSTGRKEENRKVEIIRLAGSWFDSSCPI
jgi:hypothetical protein